MKYYSLNLCGIKRQLPLSSISKKTQLANFSILGDVELVEASATAIAKFLKNVSFDYLIALEVKAVPIVHSIALKLKHKRYIVCRKSVKPYMISPIILKPLPYFPRHIKPMVIDGCDAALLKGKRVVIIDTVISTGVTMRMMKHLMDKIGATVVHLVAILKQGQPFDHFDNLYYLQEIPIFKTDPENPS